MTDITLFKNKATEHTNLRLSVLVPYYHDDPSALLQALTQQVGAGQDVEVLLYDDGTQNSQVNDALTDIAQHTDCPVTLIFAHVNKGRSTARNRLTDAARAPWILFLDADMMPETTHFLSDYLNIIKSDNTDVIFGGFTMPERATKDTELHRAFSQSSDCLSAAQREVKGPQYVCSSNLCVRAEILRADPFDTAFEGWGWEDSEWAARVAAKYRLKHADIPAKHLGLESTQTLLNRFRDSAANYDRFTQKHPELAQNLKLFKMMHYLRNIPGQKYMRPTLSILVRNEICIVPIKVRLFALKLWRASWYAERCSS